MRPQPRGGRKTRGFSLGLLALCLAAARSLQSQGVLLYIPQSTINATVQENILLSVQYSCHGVPTIEWRYTSNWAMQKIVEWKPGTQANISESHKGRVSTFDNGSIQLSSVGVRDSGYYVITVTEHLGSSQFGTIALHVSEIHYEDLHFVAVFLALLAAVAAVLISLMWVCNRCAYKFQRKRRHKLKGNPLGLVIHQFPVLRSQKAQLRRLSYRMLSVSQGWAQLHSYLKRKTFSSQRNKHSKFILQLPVVLPFNPSLMGEPEGPQCPYLFGFLCGR
ncbi:V-set and transmembrane domain-containing protein 5 isoform X2 [Cavia porcellus]|uniref:V-set and transmembrane domain-containing protein 5 isoform X2 n=1 Tax=Cavia porcellus TaxID=10141 RepID=UPI002FE22378